MQRCYGLLCLFISKDLKTPTVVVPGIGRSLAHRAREFLVELYTVTTAEQELFNDTFPSSVDNKERSGSYGIETRSADNEPN